MLRWSFYHVPLNHLQIKFIFLVGGIFYGWPSFVFLLKKEKVFYNLCEEEFDTIPSNLTNWDTENLPDTEEDIIRSCVPQDEMFNTLFVAGCAISNMVGVIYGKVILSFSSF